MICRVKYVDNREKNGLSKKVFQVGETIKEADAKILGAIGVAVSEAEYDRIAKEKGTVPFRRVEKAEK